jgi:hypothetical protein
MQQNGALIARTTSRPEPLASEEANGWGSGERVGLERTSGARANAWGSANLLGRRESGWLKRAGGARANGWGSNKTFFANQAPDCIHPPYSYSVERPSSTWSSSLGRPHVHASQRARPLLLSTSRCGALATQPVVASGVVRKRKTRAGSDAIAAAAAAHATRPRRLVHGRFHRRRGDAASARAAHRDRATRGPARSAATGRARWRPRRLAGCLRAAHGH